MIKKIMLFALGILPLLGKAQVTINAQLPPAGFVQKDQLWNLILVNNKEDILDVTIKMNLQDAATGQVVLSATSGNLLLGKGVKVITGRDVQPVVYNYNVAGLSGNYLPMGAYVACYQVIATGQKQEPLSEECIHINIDPLSPPLLNTPADKAEIQTPYPQFTWMPPTPFDMFSNLSYDLLVTEVLPSQSAAEAIEYNTPIYTKSNISQPSESYASSFTKLDTGKVYAWQVVARNGVNYAAKTEVWTFKLAKEKKLIDSVNTTYVVLNNTAGDKGIYEQKEGSLNIQYYSFEKAHTATIKILTGDGKQIQQESRKVLYGNNYFNISLSKSLTKGQVYTIVLGTEDGNKHSALFRISN